MPGNLYVPPLSVELNPIEHLRSRIKTVGRMIDETTQRGYCAISTQSSTDIGLPDNSIDYISLSYLTIELPDALPHRQHEMT